MKHLVTAKQIKQRIVALYDQFVAEQGDFPREVFTLATKQQIAKDFGVTLYRIDRALQNEAIHYGYNYFKEHVLARAGRGHFVKWEYSNYKHIGDLYLPWPKN